MADYSKKIRAELNAIAAMEQAVDDYAWSFRHVGNEKLYNEFKFIARKLNAARNAIDIAVGEKIDRDYEQACKNSATILKSALAGVKLGQDRE